MPERLQPALRPGGTVLGGAAGGFSYEGATRDAQAREDAALKPAPTRSEPKPAKLATTRQG